MTMTDEEYRYVYDAENELVEDAEGNPVVTQDGERFFAVGGDGEVYALGAGDAAEYDDDEDFDDEDFDEDFNFEDLTAEQRAEVIHDYLEGEDEVTEAIASRVEKQIEDERLREPAAIGDAVDSLMEDLKTGT